MFEGRLEAEGAVRDQVRVGRYPGVLERAAVAVQAGTAEGRFGSADDGADSSVPEVDEVFHGRERAGPVRRAHADHVRAGQVERIDDDERRSLLDDALAL